MSSRKKQQVQPAEEKEHACFSDYAYLGKIESLAFAIGMRGEGDVEEIINKILPMRKVIPMPVQEKRTLTKTSKKVVQEEICNRPECAAKRETLRECQDENEHLRSQLKAIENRVIASKNKLAIMEKSISMSEEKNEAVRGQIDESEARISALEVEVSRGEIYNDQLRLKAEMLQKEIDVLKQQTEEHTNVMQNMTNKSVQQVTFAKRVTDPKDKGNNQKEALEFASQVSKLGRQVSVNDFSDDDSR